MKSKVIKIAIADDHTIVRKGILEIIHSFGGFEVLFDAPNGKIFIEKLEKACSKPDICILDINMPEMNGYETAAAIKKRWPVLKILALSMFDTEYNIIRMLKNGANGYVLKQSNPNELMNALVRIYRYSYYHSELVSGKILNILQQNNKESTLEFSDREMEFLSLCCSEMTYKEIGAEMHVSGRTVEDYRNALFQKLNIKTRTCLAMFAIRIGLCS